MTSVPKQHRQVQLRSLSEIQVSRYDRVSSLLVALLILVGVAVALMLLIWLSQTMVFRQRSVPVTLVENAAGRGDHAPGFERDLEAPGLEEVPELAEPQLEESLDAVSEAASIDILNSLSTLTSQGERGRGDSRPAGPLGEGEDIIPRWERWEIRWSSSGLSSYAKQLDYFQIELGAMGGSANVDYAFNLSRSRPEKRSGLPREEERLYMTWKGGTLQQFDDQLLARAGIATRGRLVMQFFPADVENQLAALEMESARSKGHTDVKEFLRTVFAVRPAGGGFEFVVEEQLFRLAPP